MDWRKFLANKYVIYTVAFAMVVAFGFVYKYLFVQDYSGLVTTSTSSLELAETTVVYESSETIGVDETDSIIPTETFIYVYVCGSVKNPGVYEVQSGTILVDAINLAGGLTPEAASNHINLVMSLYENLSIYIPTQEEVVNGQYNSEVVMSNGSDAVSGVGNTSISSDSRNGLININTASRAELMTIPGIGEVTADSIIEYRENNGAFGSVDEIVNVPGIGEGKYERFREYLCV